MAVLFRLSIVAVFVVGVVAAVYAYNNRAPLIEQPIAFNHFLHLDKAGLQCADCHTDAEHAVHAGLPSKNICLDCHDIDEIQEDPDSHPDLVALAGFGDVAGDIPWKRIALTNPDVFFSHRRHVRAAGLDCLRCHPNQPTLISPPSKAQLVMTMDDCLACHEENSASADCVACHR